MIGHPQNLTVAWTFSTGVLQGHAAAPLVVGDTMHLVTPWTNMLYALDSSEQPGRVKWKYEPKPVRAANEVAGCDVVNGGGVCADGTIISNTLDNHTIAVDAETGKEVWKTRLGDIDRGESMTMTALGFVGARPDLPDYTSGGGMLYVFALPEPGGGS